MYDTHKWPTFSYTITPLITHLTSISQIISEPSLIGPTSLHCFLSIVCVVPSAKYFKVCFDDDLIKHFKQTQKLAIKRHERVLWGAFENRLP